MKYSVVVPIFNEEKSVAPLHAEIVEEMRRLGENFEIIFVDDGSTDGTAAALGQLSPATIIKFRKNFGQTAALDAGIKQAQSDFIITLDGDGQNPPAEIPKLIAKMREGNFDVVSGWRKNRQDAFSKNFVSRGANLLRKFFINDGIHDSGCTLKIYKRECFNNLDLFGEMHRFIPGVLRWQGFTVGEVAVTHRLRLHGQTKYSSTRVLKGLVDMISVWFWRKYASRPLHLFGGGGAMLTLLGLLLLLILAIARIFFSFSLSRSIWPLVAIMFILIGIQLLISGLIAEILVKNYYKNGRRPYAIKSVTQK